MPTIYSGTNDGYVSYYAAGTWATARSAATGTAGSPNLDRDLDSTAAQLISGRGGTVPLINRSFFEFDTSGISSAPSEATLKIYGYSQGTADIIAVKSTQDTSLGTNDFGAIHGCSSQIAASDGSGTGTFASCATIYSAEISTWSTSGYNDIALTSDALDDMASLDLFKVALLQYDYDYLDVASAGSSPLVRSGMYFANSSGTSNDPKIDYTAAGYGNLVNGVSSATISKINGIAAANISKVNGV